MGPDALLEWDFTGSYEGTFRFQYSDTLYDCDGIPSGCGGGTIVRFDCPTSAVVGEAGDSTLVGTLYPDLGRCTEVFQRPGDTATYLLVADTIPFAVSIGHMEIDDAPGVPSFSSSGDLWWGTGTAADFETLLGCEPLDDPVGVFYGGNPRSFPPYDRPGVSSVVAGRTRYNSGIEAACKARKVFFLAWFDVDRAG